MRKITHNLKAGFYQSINGRHGGKRKGAGRKPKYKEPTKVIGFRVPLSKINKVRETVKRCL